MKIVENLSVIGMRSVHASGRHGTDEQGEPAQYKGYKGDSNYCIEIWCNDKGKWEGDVISTFEAYRAVRQHGLARLRHPHLTLRGMPLVMRLIINDYVKANFKGKTRVLQVCKIKSVGSVFVAEHNEANVRARDDAKDDGLIYGSFSATSLKKAQARRVALSPIGDLRDPGFMD